MHTTHFLAWVLGFSDFLGNFLYTLVAKFVYIQGKHIKVLYAYLGCTQILQTKYNFATKEYNKT